MSKKALTVQLVPVTPEQSKKLTDAAYTLNWLALLTGREEHREQSDLVAHFADTRNRDFAPSYKLEIPEDES
jgi:hypothetical protein